MFVIASLREQFKPNKLSIELVGWSCFPIVSRFYFFLGEQPILQRRPGWSASMFPINIRQLSDSLLFHRVEFQRVSRVCVPCSFHGSLSILKTWDAPPREGSPSKITKPSRWRFR